MTELGGVSTYSNGPTTDPCGTPNSMGHTDRQLTAVCHLLCTISEELAYPIEDNSSYTKYRF